MGVLKRVRAADLTMFTFASKLIPCWKASSLCKGILKSWPSSTRLYLVFPGMIAVIIHNNKKTKKEGTTLPLKNKYISRKRKSRIQSYCSIAAVRPIDRCTASRHRTSANFIFHSLSQLRAVIKRHFQTITIRWTRGTLACLPSDPPRNENPSTTSKNTQLSWLLFLPCGTCVDSELGAPPPRPSRRAPRQEVTWLEEFGGFHLFSLEQIHVVTPGEELRRFIPPAPGKRGTSTTVRSEKQ